jgi:hypothetical protein
MDEAGSTCFDALELPRDRSFSPAGGIFVMPQCQHYDFETGEQCTVDVPQGGDRFCPQHKFVKAVSTPPMTGVQGTSKALWTKKTAQKTYPKSGAGGDKSGGEFLVNGAVGMHVHIYNDGGAHVKVGGDQYVFLRKPTYKFDPVTWAEGVAAVRLRASQDVRKKLLDAMVWTVAEHGGLSDTDLSALIEKLES